MHIIVKFIDAVIVLAILLIVALTILHREDYSSLLDTATNTNNVEASNSSSNTTPIETINTTDTEDISTINEE